MVLRVGKFLTFSGEGSFALRRFTICLFFLLFNTSCTNEVPEFTELFPSEEDTSVPPAHKILIDNGVLGTNLTHVNLTLESEDAVEMYITNDFDCSNPVWIPYVTNVTSWALNSNEYNQRSWIYGMFRKAENELGVVEITLPEC